MINIYRKFLLILIFTFLLTSCYEAPKVVDNHYSLDECKEELLEAKDYVGDAGIDLIVVEKKERKLYLYKKGKVQSAFPVSLGKNPEGTKEQQGDNKTPEGTFWIHRKLCSPKYYRSLCISYPRPEDRKKALAKGVNPGGDITIHAQPPWNADGKGDHYTLTKNWTQGCVAVTNRAMNQLWYAVREGVPVVIR